MEKIKINVKYLKETLLALLNIYSPSGYTDQIVHFVGEELEKLGMEFDVTRRGTIRASIPGTRKSFERSVAVHLDTLGAMVKGLKSNGRLAVAPVGTWSARFAEGGRVTVFTEDKPIRGTVLPLKSSGHVYGDEVDTLPVSWDNLEIRIDERCADKTDLQKIGFDIGDFVAFDSIAEITKNGFINARHLDDKAGVAILLSVIKALKENQIVIPVECHFLFTIFEEVGLGASSGLFEDVSELVVVDNAPIAPPQNGDEYGTIVCMMDQSGPYDYHLNKKLVELCRDYKLDYKKDIFKYYRSDSASVIEAGNDTRTALIGFGVDASHGYERVHLDSLLTTASLLALYIQTPPAFTRDEKEIATLEGFPHQPARDTIDIKT